VTDDLWKKYCSFYEKPFSEQMQHNRETMDKYFKRWKTTDLAKMLHKGSVKTFKEIPITTYSDYPMLSEFGRRISKAIRRKPRRPGEPLKEYYDRISYEIGSSLNRYMVDPFFLCMKTTGTTGESKWIAHGRTFWKNFMDGTGVANFVICCSDGWGETKLKVGDAFLNLSAPIPYMSGYGILAVSMAGFKCVPPIEVTDNLRDMREKFFLLLKVLRKEKVVAGGSVGSMFYMICKYLVEPYEFYQEYYRSMNFGLKKALLYLKLLQIKLSRREKKNIMDVMPLKGAVVAGMDSRLYMEFFKKEFGLQPLHVYGTTEGGCLMRGDPDRKADLVPDLKTSYMEFKTEDGEIKELDEIKKGEVYDLVITPFGSILFRYDTEDLFRVIDFRDDGMPIFAFEGRKMEVIDLYNYRATANVFVETLSRAGLRSSDKWAVVKIFKPREHLLFLMEKTWPYSEREAEKIIFKALMETCRVMPNTARTLRDYVTEFRIKDPSEVVRVEYLKPGSFLRYSMIKAKEGAPLGQYKPPKIIPSEKIEIYEALKNA